MIMLAGISAFAESDYPLKAGYYIWILKSTNKEIHSHVCMERSRSTLFIYFQNGCRYDIEIIDDKKIESKINTGGEIKKISGDITSKTTVSGIILTRKSPNTVEKKQFFIKKDLNPQVPRYKYLYLYKKAQEKKSQNRGQSNEINKKNQAVQKTGPVVEARNNDDLDFALCSGYYVWNIQSDRKSKELKSVNIYIDCHKSFFYFYNNAGGRYKVGIGKDNSIHADIKHRNSSVKITGNIVSPDKVKGQLTTVELSSGKTSTQRFTLSMDLNPVMTKDEFIRRYQQRNNKNSKWSFSDDSEKGKRMRKEIQRKAETENVTIDLHGVVINHKNEPVSDVRLKIYVRRYDPDGKLGMKSDIQYVTTGADGHFRVKNLTGYLIDITCNPQKGYKFSSETIRGKSSLQDLIKKTVVLKLHPQSTDKKAKAINAQKFRNFTQSAKLLVRQYGYSDKDMENLFWEINNCNEKIGDELTFDYYDNFIRGIKSGYIKILEKPVIILNTNIKPSKAYSQSLLSNLLKEWSHDETTRFNKLDPYETIGLTVLERLKHNVTALQIAGYQKTSFKGDEFFDIIGVYYNFHDPLIINIASCKGVFFDKKKQIWRRARGVAYKVIWLDNWRWRRGKKLWDEEEKYIIYRLLNKYYYSLERVITPSDKFSLSFMKKATYDEKLKKAKLYDFFHIRKPDECIMFKPGLNFFKLPTVDPVKFNFLINEKHEDIPAKKLNR